MNPLDVKRKVLGAVKGYGREGMGEHLKKGYGPAAEGKPAVAIKIESTRVEPEMGESEDEMSEGEGMMPPEMMKKHEGMEPEAVKMAEGEAEGEHMMPEGEMMKDSEMSKGEAKITPELLEMLLAKLGK
jgi:hypothetical protein